MPAEKFYRHTATPNDEPDLVIAWGTGDEAGPPQVLVNDVVYDRSALNRMIRALRRARDQVYGADE